MNKAVRRADMTKRTFSDPKYVHGMKAPITASMFILACTNSDPPMESLRATLDTFTLAAHKTFVEHGDAVRSHRNRTTGEAAAAAASGNIEDDNDDATATSMNAPEALSNMQLCSVMCR